MACCLAATRVFERSVVDAESPEPDGPGSPGECRSTIQTFHEDDLHYENRNLHSPIICSYVHQRGCAVIALLFYMLAVLEPPWATVPRPVAPPQHISKSPNVSP